MSNHTPTDLRCYWKSFLGKQEVLLFYSTREESGNRYPQFSNFYRHKAFLYTIPTWCGHFGGQSFSVEFSEKAIMLCKASLFNDTKMFEKIKHAKEPLQAKYLGRKCRFNQSIWNQYVCQIAKDVIFQKFSSVEGFKELLLGTGECIIAEAAPRDLNWGIGFAKENPKCQEPSLWRGLNILGFALMVARLKLRDEM